MDLLKFATERYSVRKFDSKPLEKEAVEKIPDTVPDERHTVYGSAAETVFYNEF